MDGRLFAWGRGDSGELGQGNLTDRSMPIPCRGVEGKSCVMAMAGSYFSLALVDSASSTKPTPGQAVAGITRSFNNLMAAEVRGCLIPWRACLRHMQRSHVAHHA